MPVFDILPGLITGTTVDILTGLKAGDSYGAQGRH